MLACKNKLFKKLLLFSFIFLLFSIFCNKVLHAEATTKTKIAKNSTHHVQVEQKKIISSLKKIEDCIDTQKEDF